MVSSLCCFFQVLNMVFKILVLNKYIILYSILRAFCKIASNFLVVGGLTL